MREGRKEKRKYRDRRKECEKERMIMNCFEHFSVPLVLPS
jgi:hypothetical protein